MRGRPAGAEGQAGSAGPRRPHRVVKLLRPVGIDQGHAAVVEAELLDQIVVARGHHIDDGVADGDHVITGFGHLLSSATSERRLSGGSWRGQAQPWTGAVPGD